MCLRGGGGGGSRRCTEPYLFHTRDGEAEGEFWIRSFQAILPPDEIDVFLKSVPLRLRFQHLVYDGRFFHAHFAGSRRFLFFRKGHLRRGGRACIMNSSSKALVPVTPARGSLLLVPEKEGTSLKAQGPGSQESANLWLKWQCHLLHQGRDPKSQSVLLLFNLLARKKTPSPLTADPADWGQYKADKVAWEGWEEDWRWAEPFARQAEAEDPPEVGMVSPTTSVLQQCDTQDYHYFLLMDKERGERATDDGEVLESIVSVPDLNLPVAITQVPKLVPVPVPKYQLWFLHPFQHAWYPYSYPYPFHCTRTHTEVPVPVPLPIFQPSLVPIPVPTGWYPYPYPGTCSGTRTHTRVPVLVPIPIKSVNPSSFVSIILVPLLLHYPTHCTHVCGFVSLYLQCSDSTDTHAKFVDYFHSAKKRCFT